MKILVINAGSSSLRYEVFEKRGSSLHALHKGHFDGHGKSLPSADLLVKKILSTLITQKIIKKADEITSVGHRVVHGGEKYFKPTLITQKVLKEISALSELAPLHNPFNIAGIKACKKLFPRAKQVAVFDTGFHHTMPEKAYLYALPSSLYTKQKIRRYGFHGTSHEYVFGIAQKKLGKAATKKTITCHLGNGCSLAAIVDGKVIDTSMGFTPLEGVPMGTRSGDIDPAIIFHLIKKGMSPAQVEKLITKESGLLGISGISSDVRPLWAAYKKKNKAAKRTMEIFAYHIAKYIGAYQAAMKGLDCIVFTGGIGENAHYLRKWILEYFPKFPTNRVLVIPTNEALQIAQKVTKM